MSEQQPAQCAQCSRGIDDADVPVVRGDEWFHFPCWQVLFPADTIRESRKLTRRSRESLDTSRELVERLHALAPAAGHPELLS